MCPQPAKPAVQTILAVALRDSSYGSLVESLRRAGCLVLEAHDAASALEAVRMHSRTIHLMLIDSSIESRTLAAALKRFRPRMRVLFVARDRTEETTPAVTSYDDALDRVWEILREQTR